MYEHRVLVHCHTADLGSFGPPVAPEGQGLLCEAAAAELSRRRGREMREAVARDRLAVRWLRGLAWAGGLLIGLGCRLQRPAERAGLPVARASVQAPRVPL
jgi:hypothetical protein